MFTFSTTISGSLDLGRFCWTAENKFVHLESSIFISIIYLRDKYIKKVVTDCLKNLFLCIIFPDSLDKLSRVREILFFQPRFKKIHNDPNVDR